MEFLIGIQFVAAEVNKITVEKLKIAISLYGIWISVLVSLSDGSLVCQTWFVSVGGSLTNLGVFLVSAKNAFVPLERDNSVNTYSRISTVSQGSERSE